jgi:cellulose synthase/poly-beta-1,6-N-acetylglucosamine synthase-like glycosyltransferase
VATPFLALGLLFFLLAIHPFVTYPLSLLAVRKLRRPKRLSPDPDAPEPSFAVCMCAYNEERVIEAKMENLLALREREPGLEILVYVDAASDRTADILRRYEDRITLHVSPERHGKTHGMNLLVSKARASLVVFTDANVLLDLDALRNLRRYFADPEVGCVCGNLVYTNADSSVTAASGSLYWKLEEFIKKLEEESGSIMGADGSLFAIRRALHRPPPDHIIDDMYVSFMILCEGYRIVQATDVRAFEESVTSAREEFRRKVRIACQAFNVHRLIWPRLRQLDGITLYQYVSHKLIRWLSIYFLVAAGLCFEAALIASGRPDIAAALAGSALLVLALGHFAAVKPFAQITDILAALAGAGLGVWQSVRGTLYQTWTPAASIRKS